MALQPAATSAPRQPQIFGGKEQRSDGLEPLKFKARLGASLQQILRLLQLNLFERRNLIDLFKPPEKQPAVSPQLLLFQNL